MRTTVDLPPAMHRRVSEMARERGQSMSSVLAELTALGLARSGEPSEISTDDVSGLPVISIGRALTSEQVAELLDDE